ncbi:Bifunctional protein FolD protein [uncultured archaeon]|nr:Bifunctional protein FolD protein [uncultured archaeon]
MAAKLIDGRKMAEEVLEGVKKKVAALRTPPCLAIILVGEDPASMLYTRKKHEDCQKVGIVSRDMRLPAKTTQKQLVAEIQKLNTDDSVDGILVQLPLPAHLDEDMALLNISPEKDVDGLHPLNFGNMAFSLGSILPCTPAGVIHMLKASKVQLQGKHAVVLGRSRMVGKPLALLLLNEDCTVTICHSRTRGLPSITRQADILCSAVGKANTVTADMVKEGAVVIDIGTNKADGKLVGDVDFEKVKENASLITPVPGGVGPMTRAMLLENTLACYKERRAGRE